MVLQLTQNLNHELHLHAKNTESHHLTFCTKSPLGCRHLPEAVDLQPYSHSQHGGGYQQGRGKAMTQPTPHTSIASVKGKLKATSVALRGKDKSKRWEVSRQAVRTKRIGMFRKMTQPQINRWAMEHEDTCIQIAQDPSSWRIQSGLRRLELLHQSQLILLSKLGPACWHT